MTPPRFSSRWERFLGKTDSPIESRFLASFCELAVEHGFEISKKQKRFFIRIEPQRKLGPIRLDFLVSYPCHTDLLEIAVECDGFNFHERTPEQASKDRARDRTLQMAGIKIFRFTGSEINASPMSCALEVLTEIENFQTKTIAAAIRKGGGGMWHELDRDF